MDCKVKGEMLEREILSWISFMLSMVRDRIIFHRKSWLGLLACLIYYYPGIATFFS
jgi:hypothetical protein